MPRPQNLDFLEYWLGAMGFSSSWKVWGGPTLTGTSRFMFWKLFERLDRMLGDGARFLRSFLAASNSALKME